jgi:hypothetical protein
MASFRGLSWPWADLCAAGNPVRKLQPPRRRDKYGVPRIPKYSEIILDQKAMVSFGSGIGASGGSIGSAPSLGVFGDILGDQGS